VAGILVQLKLRLLLNALRSNTAAKTSFIVSSVFALILAIVTFAGLAALRHNGAAVDLTAVLYTTFAFGWLILPLLVFGLDSTLDPATLALYPLRTRPLMVGLLAASVTGAWPLANLIGELGITVGLAHGALAVVVAVVAAVLQVLFCIALARWVTTALAGLLRSRRGRDLAALAIIPIFGLYETFAQVLPKAIGQHQFTAASFAGVDAWLRWLPPGLAAHAVQDASTGHAGLAVARLALLLGIIAVLVALWGRSLRRALVTADTSTQTSAVHSGALPFATGLFGRRQSLTATIGARVWVYQRRDPTSMIYWGLTVVVMVVVSIDSLRGHSNNPVAGVLLSAGLGAAIIGSLHANVIALTGPPFYLDTLAVGGRKAMRAWFAGHDIVFAALGVPLILIVPMAIAIISGHPANGFLAWALGLAALGGALGISNFCSAAFAWPAVKRPGAPTPRPADGFGGQNVASRIGTLLGTGILVVPVIIAIIATGSVSDGIRMPVLIVGGAAYGALLTWAGATIAGTLAQAQLPDLFQLAARTSLLSADARATSWRPGVVFPADDQEVLSVRKEGAVTFDEFVHAEMGGLSRFAGALTGDRYLAEDILSDALVKVARRWRRIGSLDDPAAYVRRVIVTTYLDDRRKAQRRRTDPSGDIEVLDRPAPDLADAVVNRAEVDRLLAALPPQQKAAVVLRYLLDESDETIADTLGCTTGTVRSHLSRARTTLRLVAADGEGVTA
jgi:ABC-2 type transport system permease protein